MTGRSDILEQLGVDVAAAESVLTASRRDPAAVLPWYVQAMIGAGAWMAAIFAIGLIVSVVALVFDPDDPEILLAVLGALGYGGALAIRRPSPPSLFLTQLSAVFGVAGVVSMAAAGAMLFESAWAAAAILAVIAVVNIALGVASLFQFLVAAMAIIMLQVALFDDKVPGGMTILALVTLLPGIGLIRFPPPRWETYPTAIACLFAVPAYDAFLWSWLLSNHGRLAAGAWSPLVLGILMIFAGLLWDGHRRQGAHPLPPGLILVGLAGGLAILALPPGGATLVVVLLLAHGIGSWPLAVAASVLEGFFLWRFYYDLQMTLLVKSGILFGIGLLLLGAWLLMSRRQPHAGIRSPSA